MNLVTPLHKATKRDYIERMVDGKVEAMLTAKEYGQAYWDGSRRYGYGGYKYIPGRWKKVAEELIRYYNLRGGSRVLDVGCGKGFLLHEMLLIEPNLIVSGMDISPYAIACAPIEVKNSLKLLAAQDQYPYVDSQFDLVISLGTLHNLNLKDIQQAVTEISRVGKSSFLMVESYRNEQELFNLQCWALTCKTFLDVDTWKWYLESVGYKGQYEFIFFE